MEMIPLFENDANGVALHRHDVAVIVGRDSGLPWGDDGPAIGSIVEVVGGCGPRYAPLFCRRAQHSWVHLRGAHVEKIDNLYK